MGLVRCVALPVIALFVFGVHQLVNARSPVDFFLPFPISPSLCVVLQDQNLVYEWAPVL